jgi:hypothetical protein
MDIKRELEDFEASTDYGDGLIQYLKIKEEELKKTRYLLRVISLAKRLESLISTNFFRNAEIEFIRIELDLIPRRVGEPVYTFNSEFFDKDRNIISSYVKEGVITDEAHCLRGIYNKFILPEGLPADLVSSKIQDSLKHFLELNSEFREQILDLFLSDELKKVYEYNKMNIELPVSSEDSSKKLKI